MRPGRIVVGKSGSRFDETLCIYCEATIKPGRTGNCACHDEEMSDVVGFDIPGHVVSPADAFEMVAAFQRHNFRLCSQDDIGVLLQTANQITRHAFCQPARSDEHVNALGGLREKYRSLPRRVPSADNSHFFSTA